MGYKITRQVTRKPYHSSKGPFDRQRRVEESRSRPRQPRTRGR